MIGLPATLELGEAYNGVRVYIPTMAHDDHAIAKLIGSDCLEELVRQFGGEEIQFPKLDAAVRQIKVRMISEMLEARLSTKEIALSTFHVHKPVKEAVSIPGQPRPGRHSHK